MARCRVYFNRTESIELSESVRSSTQPRKTPIRKRTPKSGRRRNPSSEIDRNITFTQQADESRFYVIEKLLNKRFNPDTRQEEYLVRWQNYPPEWDSWEPRTELERNSMDMILAFNKTPNEADETLHCTCRKPYRFDDGGMIQCFNCLEWFHFKCLSIDMEEANSYAKYYCISCRASNSYFKNVVKPEKIKTAGWTSSQDTNSL